MQRYQLQSTMKFWHQSVILWTCLHLLVSPICDARKGAPDVSSPLGRDAVQTTVIYQQQQQHNNSTINNTTIVNNIQEQLTYLAPETRTKSEHKQQRLNGGEKQPPPKLPLLFQQSLHFYTDTLEKIVRRISRSIHSTGDNFQNLMQYDPQQSIYYVQKKPRIVRPPESVATTVGQSVLFVCLVEGNPAPKVQWKVSGTDVSEARFGKTVRAPRGSVLRVTNALPSHNGAVITCTATNALGHAEQSANLIVYADESAAPPGYPRFLNSFSVIVAKKNAAVELECRASGDPQPEIDWYKNSVPVDLTNPRFEKLNEGNLRISNLVEEDEGKYECAATNSKGTRLSSGDNLLVRENVETSLQLIAPSTKRFRPHFTNIPVPRQIVPPGGRLALTCTAVGAPVPTVDWYRGNRRLHRERLDQQPPGTARILLLDLSESINVTCVAESPMGRIYHDVQVVVKMLPNPPGRPYLADLGALHARVAFEPSAKSVNNSTVTNYLLFWIASKQFNNETLHAIPQNALAMLQNPNGALSVESLFHSDQDEKPLRFILIPPTFHRVTKIGEDQVKLVQNLSTNEPINKMNHFVAILGSVTQLRPYTEYTVWARAVGFDGDASFPGPTITFTTHELAPTSPPRDVHAQAISNAAVTVYWDAPSEANGRIRAYRVHYTDRPQLELPFWDTSIMDVDETNKSSNLEQKAGQVSAGGRTTPGHLFLLTHLIADTTYYIRVSAVNGKGEGPPSDISIVIVRPGLLSQPRNLTATVQSSHEIELVWEPPSDVDQSSRPLKNYHLLYAPMSTIKSIEKPKWAAYLDAKMSGVEQLEIEPGLKRILISGLKPDTQYLFNMASVSNSGSGVRAVAYGRTKRFVPAAPTDLTVEAVSSTELEVCWKPPARDARSTQEATTMSTRIAYYDLSWRPSTSTGGWLRSDQSPSPWFNQMGSASSLPETNGFNRRLVPVQTEASTVAESYKARIPQLQPGTYYVIHLRAVAPSGSGDRAVASPVRTWDHPPTAPRNLRLLSQIIPPTGPSMPPQVLLRAAWDASLTLTDRTELEDLGGQARNETFYRIRWRLLLERTEQAARKDDNHKRLRRALSDSDWSLYWQGKDKNDRLTQTDYMIPVSLRGGEVNITGTNWNPTPGQFLLGMTYEINVAAITPVQVGQEAIETLTLEGAAPTAAPIDLTLMDQSSPNYLTWQPPDWSHRHGPFVAYEVKCWHSNSTTDTQQNSVGESFMTVNLTLDPGHVQWPGQTPLDSHWLIAWPNAQVALQSLIHVDSVSSGLPARVVCLVRGQTVYGYSPWSPATTVLPRRTTSPSPPKEVRAILMVNGELRVSWAMPPGLIQTVQPNSVTWIGDQSDTPFASHLERIVYRRFAVYVSPDKVKNWTRQLTSGPVTEWVVSNCDPRHDYVVRVSAVDRLEQEGTWSTAIRAERISAGSEIAVHNLTCSLFYTEQTGRWNAELSWATPSRLLRGMHLGRLLHYRVNYTRLRSHAHYQQTTSRESSVRILDANSPPSHVTHSIYGLESNSIYAVSVRPVLKSVSVSTKNDWTDLYGSPLAVSCVTPDKPTSTIQPPWVIGSVRNSKGLSIGCPQMNWTRSNPERYELVALRLNAAGNVDTSEEVSPLAIWTTDPSVNGESRLKPVRVELTGPDNRAPKPHHVDKGHEFRLTGRALQPDTVYALALRVFSKIPAPNGNLGRSTEPLYFQSVWLHPVSLNQAAVGAPKIFRATNSEDWTDIDRVLWISQNKPFGDTSVSHKPPSDDATARGPDGMPPLSLDPSAKIDPPILSPGASMPDSRLQKSKSRVSLVVTIISTTALLIGLGLVCLLIILYRRRKRDKPAAHAQTKYAPYDTWSRDSVATNDRHRTGKLWPHRCTPVAYSTLLSWVNPNKRSPKRHLPGTRSLVEVHGPPPGTLASYSAGLGHSFPDDNFSGAILNGTINGFDNTNTVDRLATSVAATNFGSLRKDAIRTETNNLRLMDSPNSTLYATDPRNGIGLSRVDSVSLGHRGVMLNSPSPTTIFPANYTNRIGHQEGLPACNGFTAGSLKSMTTLGSRNLPVFKPTGSITLPNGRICGSRLIGIGQLMETVQALKADNGRLMAAEFESIDPGGQFTWEHSNRPGNRVKNRYANVIAYDHSRVVLQPVSGTDPDSDYINANYLDGYRKQNAYIATQGPLPHTVADFWRMVWEQRSAMIVSMTRLEERARVKCEQYWPGTSGTLSFATGNGQSSMSRLVHSKLMDNTKLWTKESSVPPPTMFRGTDYINAGDDSLVFSNEHSYKPLLDDCTSGWTGLGNAEVISEATYGELTVGLIDSMELAYYTMRTFVLHRLGCSERREVRQLQFTAWPDHGVPNHPAPLLMFLRRVRAESPPDVGPVVVHCSAGVGRTGAFILLDILLEQMRHEKAVDVFGAVSRLRSQRNFMVQTEDQYAFVYEALVEAAASGNTELSVRQLSAHWARLIKADSTVIREFASEENPCTTGLELEFSQLVAQTQLSRMTLYLPRANIGLLSPIDPFSIHDEDRFQTGLTNTTTTNSGPLSPRFTTPESGTLKPSAALARANLSKNRHLDIVPHDANRVALKAVRGVDGSDYINASYIDGYRTRAAYIATQAPLTCTLEDFWRMIWETGSCLIVRLESTSSINDPKSADSLFYWPTVQSARHGFLVIDPIATYSMNSYILRELRITDTRDGTTRTIRQFDATPTTDAMIEFDCPHIGFCSRRINEAGGKLHELYNSDPLAPSSPQSHADSLLDTSITKGSSNANRLVGSTRPLSSNFKQRYQPLCEAMLETVIQVHKTKEHFGMDGPITVHCNLGAGRTGVFLAIALVLQRMRYEGVVDMFQTVKLLRWQRPGLVNTAAEYAFCYATALEYLDAFERYTN